MAQDVTVAGASYSDVPAVVLPKSGGGEATFYDLSELTYVESINGQSGVVTLEIPPTMTILSYGNSTWQDFINAYNSNTIVYCRASSNSNPATGNQTRMAFMAYVNSNPPTNVEFQYYRSVNSHSASQQGDQVYIYKLDKTAGWSVTVREAMSKIVAGTGLSSSYSSGTLTLTNAYSLPTASTSTLGGVKVDGTTVTIDGSGVISASGGGTGASTATCILGTTGWSNDSITVIVTGVTSSNNVIVSPAPTSVAAYTAAGIVCTAQGLDELTFTRTSANAESITVNVLILS